MLEVITSFLSSVVSVEYVSLMFVCIGVLGLVIIIRRFIMNNM